MTDLAQHLQHDARLHRRGCRQLQGAGSILGIETVPGIDDLPADAVVDLVVVAAGFVLRAIAGAVIASRPKNGMAMPSFIF